MAPSFPVTAWSKTARTSGLSERDDTNSPLIARSPCRRCNHAQEHKKERPAQYQMFIQVERIP
jgi:hypothetical protein